jgi:hypothetical protein
MSRIVTGRLYYPDSSEVTDATLSIVAKRHSYSAADGAVPYHVDIQVDIDSSGDFSIDIPAGEYDVRLLSAYSTWYSIGTIVVNPSDTSNITMGELIELSRDDTWDADAAETWATKAYVDSALACGRDPGTLPITDLGVGTLDDGDIVVRKGSALGSAPLRARITAATGETAEAFGRYAITAGHTLNLPSSPVAGDWIVVYPLTTWHTLNSVLGDGTDTIEGSTQALTLDWDRFYMLTYIDVTTGWTVSSYSEV